MKEWIAVAPVRGVPCLLRDIDYLGASVCAGTSVDVGDVEVADENKHLSHTTVD
jgi:hypothetical protein